jgi:hypothetical protein
MVEQALILFTASTIGFLVLLVVVKKERSRKERFFAAAPRAWLDQLVSRAETRLQNGWRHFARYVVQLHWYYSIHSVLRGTLRCIVAVYTYFEDIFERNRQRTKRLRAEKREVNELNHLRQMATHKQATALSAAEKKKLRRRKLEDDQ